MRNNAVVVEHLEKRFKRGQTVDKITFDAEVIA